MEKKKINPKFGSKIEEVFEIIHETKDWEKYVSDKTAKVIKTLYETQSMNDTIDILDMKYITIRAHILRAIERISEKKTDYARKGQSRQSRELFKLMDETPNWKEYVTDHEAELAEKYREVKNFYKLSKMVGVAPSNIAGALYGTKQKLGVISKIKLKVPQTERRDIDNRRGREKEE